MNRRKSGGGVSVMLNALILTLILSFTTFGQTGTSSISGTVTDPQGNVMPGVTVTISNPQKNFTRTQTTNESGAYSFSAIPPDAYAVEVTAQGFKKAMLNDIRALVAKPTEANVQLEIGDVAETVSVVSGSAAELVNNQDASLGNNFVSQQITELPLEARNVNSLLTLQPGATREGYVAGARADQSNVTLDGVDINEAQTNQVGTQSGGPGSDAMKGFSDAPDSGTVLRLNAEAVEEFRVTTSNPNAAMGRSSGAQISLISKGGTNQFHGALFEYHRNTIFTANDFFNNRNGRYTADDEDVLLGLKSVGEIKNPRPKLIRNTFGGAIGGPIIKDRAFFFYSFEGRRDASETTIVQRVPLPSLGRGEIRYVTNAKTGEIATVTAAQLAALFPEMGVNPAAISALAAAAAKYPANDFTLGDSSPGELLNTAGFRFNAPTPVTLNSHVGKLDVNLTSKQQLLARISVQHDSIGGTRAFPDTPAQDMWSHPWGLVIGHLWTINNSLVNNFRYGLTRESFTEQGDAAKNEIYFRNIFFPVNDSRTNSRTTPVQNFVDDLSWVTGNHTVQFGTNVRIIRNRSISYANAYDTAFTNPSGYSGNGNPISNRINAFKPIATGAANVRNAATALFGRLTSYTARFTFDRDGKLLPQGTPSEREFATEEYDAYGQDVWKIRPNLTITYGLRYGISRPVYETSGFETKPNIPLSEYFQRRLAGAAAGTPYTEPLSVELSGPANGRSSMYRWDKNNFQPRVAVAWSPNFKSGFLGKLFGYEGQSVFRGGFAITNDYYGQQLAVSFDSLNKLGFSTLNSLSAGTCDITTKLCPLFTGFTQSVRDLPGVVIPGSLTFPQTQPSDNSRRIESSLDENLVAPIHYSWNVTFERTLPKGLVITTSYVGRAARNLMATRDIMALNNLVDPKSGMDWYMAAGMLEDYRRNGVAINDIPVIPYFENIFGAVPNFARNVVDKANAGLNATRAVYADAVIYRGNDWTQIQADIDDALDNPVFYHPQYGALSAVGSIGRSNYHAGTLSVRERLGSKLTLDFNYTLSHSMDDASGLQTSGTYGTSFILNSIRQSDNYADSDFDVRQIINMNGVWQLPVGRGQWLFGDANKVVNGFLGGWQLSGIFRWNSGLPIYSPYDSGRWATNWNIESSGVRIRPVQACPTRGGVDEPNLFGCDKEYAYQSWRNPKPGETGDRNVIRLPGYISLDMGLAKSFTMPWGEGHKLQIRADAFNVTNTQRLGSVSGLQLDLDPQDNTPPSDWWNFTGIQGTPRVIQFGVRYSF